MLVFFLLDAGLRQRGVPGVLWEREGSSLKKAHQPVMVWCDVVWCGVVWCGVVWCGVVWCGVVWCGVVWCGVVWCGVVWCDVVWCGVVWCGVEEEEERLPWSHVR